MSTVVAGIRELVTNDPATVVGWSSASAEFATPTHHSLLGIIEDAAVVVEDGRIVWVGPAGDAPEADEAIDVDGRAVLPGFVDSHSHLVFAGDRAAEFEARMTGTPYDGGGITTTVRATREASDEELRARIARLVAEMTFQGTTTVEVKSGYGLTVDDEVRSLRLAREVTDETTLRTG